MADKPPDRFDLESVLLNAVEGSESDAEREWLNQSLLASEEVRAAASQFLMDESLLADQSREVNVAERTLESLRDRNRSTSDHESGVLPLRVARRAYGTLNRNGVAVAVASAAAVLALVVVNVSTSRQLQRLQASALPGMEGRAGSTPPQTGTRDDQRAKRPVEVGRVVALERVAWQGGQRELDFGDAVMQGQTLHIESGVVELLMATGAKVTVEGPSHFMVGSANESTLSAGKLAAAVPRNARGYTINTPTSELVDIGTQFGVAVDNDGVTELHVFDGDVVARSLAGNLSQSEYVHATESHIIRFDDTGLKSKPASESDIAFIRHAGRAVPAEQVPPLPVNEGLFVWYAEETLGDAEVGSPIPIWRDLLVGDNDFANDAWQFERERRPRLVIDRAGRKALRFDGWTTAMHTAPSDLSDGSSVFVACTPGPTSFASDYHGGILVKLGASPSLELTMLPNNTPRAWVWPGVLDGQSNVNVGKIAGDRVPAEDIAIVAYRFDPTRSESTMWVNSERSGEADAPIAIGGSGRICVGAHPDDTTNARFLGLIHEVIVYNRPLDEDSVGLVSTYLQTRHQREAQDGR